MTEEQLTQISLFMDETIRALDYLTSLANAAAPVENRGWVRGAERAILNAQKAHANLNYVSRMGGLLYE